MSEGKSKPRQYAGRLSASEIAEGMNAASNNAKRLAFDARLLFDAGRYASATSLAALSIEESGKVSVLRHLAVAKSEDEVRACWKEYRTHTKKNTSWILPDLIAGGARSLEDMKQVVDPTADHPLILDKLKQLGFYSDCFGEGKWHTPDPTIDASLAETMLVRAELLSKGHEVTTEEIELWIKHLGPVWGGPLEWMKTALINWHNEAKSRGLVDGEMEAFVRGQPGSKRGVS